MADDVNLVQVAIFPVEPSVAWDFLMDIPRMARCVPGAGPVEEVDADRYRGTIKVRVGPVNLALAGDVVVVSRDREALTAVMKIEATDRSIGGAVQADVEIHLDPQDGETPSTRMTISTDARILGRIGEFGQPMIKRKADQIVGQFAQNLERALQANGGAHA